MIELSRTRWHGYEIFWLALSLVPIRGFVVEWTPMHLIIENMANNCELSLAVIDDD